MEWNASTGLALGIVSTLTPWFFAIHSKLATLAEQTSQGAKKIDALAAATARAFEKLYEFEKRLNAQDVRLQNVGKQTSELAETLAD
ncbi:MAG: hypothetical protein IKU86_06640 [Thermoguttaceae bacterium]|nr:hypothetical protein [Thermoguttaceae bacterium]